MPLRSPSSRCTLSKALNYENDSILHKFREQFDVSMPEARRLWKETKKMLWLFSVGKGFIITRELKILDEMWHTFILFTREYHDYCSRFGRYIHHAPTEKHEKDKFYRQIRKRPAATAQKRARELKHQYELIFDELGEATLLKWYVEYPLKYDYRFFKRVKNDDHATPSPARTRRLRLLSAQMRSA